MPVYTKVTFWLLITITWQTTINDQFVLFVFVSSTRKNYFQLWWKSIYWLHLHRSFAHSPFEPFMATDLLPHNLSLVFHLISISFLYLFPFSTLFPSSTLFCFLVRIWGQVTSELYIFFVTAQSLHSHCFGLGECMLGNSFIE